MEKYFQISFWLSLAGVVFAGYLAGVKFFVETCAFNEPCPYFLGYPACYFGFGLFLTLAILSSIGLFNPSRTLVGWISFVSFVGVLFAGYFTVPEMKLFLSGVTDYTLGLPTCSYGLIFFTLVFFISIFNFRKTN